MTKIEKEKIVNFIDALMESDYSKANKNLGVVIREKIKTKIYEARNVKPFGERDEDKNKNKKAKSENSKSKSENSKTKGKSENLPPWLKNKTDKGTKNNSEKKPDTKKKPAPKTKPAPKKKGKN